MGQRAERERRGRGKEGERDIGIEWRNMISVKKYQYLPNTPMSLAPNDFDIPLYVSFEFLLQKQQLSSAWSKFTPHVKVKLIVGFYQIATKIGDVRCCMFNPQASLPIALPCCFITPAASLPRAHQFKSHGRRFMRLSYRPR